jgi:hypothetical protein
MYTRYNHRVVAHGTRRNWRWRFANDVCRMDGPHLCCQRILASVRSTICFHALTKICRRFARPQTTASSVTLVSRYTLVPTLSKKRNIYIESIYLYAYIFIFEILFCSMFVLNPGGSGGSSGSGSGSSNSQKVLWYFAQLGLYFVTLRGVYLFFNARENNNSRALEQK